MLHRDLSSFRTLSTEDDMPQITPSMRALAHLGAEVRFRELTEHLTKLQSERAILLKLFPELGADTGSKTPAASEPEGGSTSKKRAAPVQRRRRKVSDAQRRSASEKMKQYWAKRWSDELLAKGRQGAKVGDGGIEGAESERVSA
jgi:hypothetical protein